MARACQAARTMAVLLTPIKEIQSCVLLPSLKQHALAMKASFQGFLFTASWAPALHQTNIYFAKLTRPASLISVLAELFHTSVDIL